MAGTARKLIDRRLQSFPAYEQFLEGTLSRDEYQEIVKKTAPARFELNEDQYNLSTRFPIDEVKTVAGWLDQLREQEMLPETKLSDEGFPEYFARIQQKFDHGQYLTYIFPEEARVLYQVAREIRPQRTIFVGSYYGYWSAFAMDGIQAVGGTAVLVDPDTSALALSQRNLKLLGYSSSCHFVAQDAALYLEQVEETYDLVVLDAEGPSFGVEPEWTGKRLYLPLVQRITPRLRPRGLLVAHNMLLQNLTNNLFFRDRITLNKDIYQGFLEHIERHYDRSLHLASSEGVGVYRRA